MSNNFTKKIDKNLSECITLDKAELNKTYVIVSCDLSQNLQTRFAELGFVRGVKVSVIKKAPLGNPLEVSILGYSLCARANELKHITVTEASDE